MNNRGQSGHKPAQIPPFLQRHTPSNALKGHIAKQHLPNSSSVDSVAEGIATYIRTGVHLVYAYGAAKRDRPELRKISAQIDAGIEGKGGVTIVRYTIYRRDGMGNGTPQYVGLGVAGFGIGMNGNSDAGKSVPALESKKAVAISKAGYVPRVHVPEGDWATPQGVCTIENPTGRSSLGKKEGPTLKAAPKGLNIGYAAQIARELMPVMQNNPENNASSLILHQDYVGYDYFYVSAKDWEEIKRSWQPPGGGGGNGTQSSAPSAPASSGPSMGRLP